MKSPSKNSASKPRASVEERFIEDDQYRIILACLPEGSKPIFVVAYHLPLPQKELLGLGRDQVNLHEKHLFLNRHVGESGNLVKAPSMATCCPGSTCRF